jgi:hypothetical protein
MSIQKKQVRKPSKGLLDRWNEWLDSLSRRWGVLGLKIGGMVFIFAFLLILLDIKADSLTRENDRLQKEVEGVRAQYTAHQASFTKSAKQTEVLETSKQVGLGLQESVVPPQKIVITEAEKTEE